MRPLDPIHLGAHFDRTASVLLMTSLRFILVLSPLLPAFVEVAAWQGLPLRQLLMQSHACRFLNNRGVGL